MLHGRLLGTHCRRAWAKEGKHSPWPWPWPLGVLNTTGLRRGSARTCSRLQRLPPAGFRGENRWILTQVMC